MRENLKPHSKIGSLYHSGFCPQYDIIYDDLTPAEHIRFYGELKGIAKADYEAYMKEQFSAVQMEETSLNTPVAHLSAGIKRKLSIAIAFLGILIKDLACTIS